MATEPTATDKKKAPRKPRRNIQKRPEATRSRITNRRRTMKKRDELKNAVAAQKHAQDAQAKAVNTAGYDSARCEGSIAMPPDLEIDVILDGVQFRKKEDRAKLTQQIGMLVARRNRRTAMDMLEKGDRENSDLRTRIHRLENELRRESRRHAEDLVEAHGGNSFGGTCEVALAG